MPAIKINEVQYTRAQHYAALVGHEPNAIERAALDEADQVSDRMAASYEAWKAGLNANERRMMRIR